MRSRVYVVSFQPNVTAYDLAWHIDDIARKYGVAETRPFLELNNLMHRFTIERTADAAIRNYEADKRVLKGDQLGAMARVFEVTPDMLMPVNVDSARSALELLFRLEGEFGLEPVGDGKLGLSGKGARAPKLAAAIKAWERQSEALGEGRISKDEYENPGSVPSRRRRYSGFFRISCLNPQATSDSSHSNSRKMGLRVHS